MLHVFRYFESCAAPSRTGLRRGPKSRSAWRSSSAQTGSCSPGGMAAAPTPLSSSWIRTDVWVLPWLRWCPSTYWLYRVSEDEMLRLVYAGDRVVWQYRLLRVVRENGTRTRFYDEFVA